MSAAGWVPSVVLIRSWFPVRVGTALGAASAGIGVGIFALVPFPASDRRTRLALGPACARAADRRLDRPGHLSGAKPERGAVVGTAARPAGPATTPRRHWAVRTAVRSWRFWGTSAVFFAGARYADAARAQVAYLVDHGASAGRRHRRARRHRQHRRQGGWGALSDRIGREVTYSSPLAASPRHRASGPGRRLPAQRYGYAALIGVGYAVTAPLTPAIARPLALRFARIFGLLQVTNSLGVPGGVDRPPALRVPGSYGLALPIAAGMALLAPALCGS
jgi:hypothetical protein